MELKLCALIVDDEEGARKLLSKLLEETLLFREIKSAQSVASARNVLSDFDPDIIFLDIKMPGKDGFAIAEDLKDLQSQPGIVFVTAFEQYAIQAIKHNAFDYLLKPVNRKELKQCISKFIESRKIHLQTRINTSAADLTEKIPRIKVNTRNGTLFINPVQILYCKADGNYTTICTGDKKQLCSMNLGKVAEQLPKNGFVRVGRSHIVNFEYITMLDRKESLLTLEREGDSVTIRIPRHHLKDLDVF
jgi:two-component system, LytTR family, response regulator